MKCLIIAAGRGERLKQKGIPKPLVPILGIPLIARVIHTAVRAGVDDFLVVTGYEGERIRSYLTSLADELGIRITCVKNSDWRRGNGWSVLRAADLLKDPFLLLMADHLVDERTLERLKREKPEKDGVKLVVDRRVHHPLIDLRDAMKVRLDGDRVLQVGKDLKDYDAIDTGIFLGTPALFEAIRESIMAGKGDTLSDGIQVLAGKGKVTAVEMGDDFWIDVDDVFGLQRAERALLNRLRKSTDGPVSKALNRPLSLRLTRQLIRYQVTPSQITLVSFLLSLMASCLFLVCRPWALVAGGILAQVASIVDGCDGEVARLTFRESESGKWLDAVLDRYADGLLIAGMTLYTLCAGGTKGVLAAGFLALVGSFVVSYTADKYDAMMKDKIVSNRFRIGRDVRIFILFLGAVFLVPAWSLWALAVLMNLEALRRIFVATRKT